MAFSTNGSTLSFGGSDVGELTDLSFSTEGAKIDVTNMADTIKAYEVGISDIECECEINGHPSGISKGDTGAISLVWNDGTTDTLTNSVCVSIETEGAVDEATKSTITFAPAS